MGEVDGQKVVHHRTFSTGENEDDSSSICVYKLTEGESDDHFSFMFSSKGNSALISKYEELLDEDGIAHIDFIAQVSPLENRGT